MVRNLKSIISSMEKLYRNSQEYHQAIQNHVEMTGTSTGKRIDLWFSGPPVGLALERMQQCFLEGLNENFLYIRAEDLTNNPQSVMNRVYKYLGLESFKHDFDNVEQTVKEDDSVYGLSKNLHTIRTKVQPVKEDYEQILSKNICNWIDNNSSFTWYQREFGYIN
jgi:hypothetical protein